MGGLVGEEKGARPGACQFSGRVRTTSWDRCQSPHFAFERQGGSPEVAELRPCIPSTKGEFGELAPSPLQESGECAKVRKSLLKVSLQAPKRMVF